MKKKLVATVSIIIAVIVVSASPFLVQPGRSQSGQRALYFSVATKSTSGSFTGDFITIFGSGTFDSQGGVNAKGIWSIQTSLPPSSTNTLTSGQWVATKVVSFVSFGIANPRGEGGQVVLTVTFLFDSGQVLPGITLTMTCRIGLTSPPPPAEGVTLAGPLSFDTPVTGITTFGEPAQN